MLCVNQQIGNQGLDARCRGLARAMRAAGGRSHVLGVDDQSPATPRKIADAVRSGRIDGVLALNATSGIEAVKGARRLGGTPAPKIATFDLGPDVLRAVRAHQLLFAVDQQAYLQGYLPIVLLTERARYGLFPAQGDVLPTGPNFVTARDAGKAIELSKRSIRSRLPSAGPLSPAEHPHVERLAAEAGLAERAHDVGLAGDRRVPGRRQGRRRPRRGASSRRAPAAPRTTTSRAGQPVRRASRSR